jgi:hypothetical protein
MTLKDFKSAIAAGREPAEISEALRAMWHDASGNWERAHDIAQEIHGADGSWIHAYLHRKEGDQSNAAYWYGRAGRPVCKRSLDDEWDEIATALLQQNLPGAHAL